MRRYQLPLAAAVVATALLSVVNVQAFRSASANETATITVARTDQAALALISNSPLANYGSNGMLSIDFSYGSRQMQLASAGPSVAADTLQMRKIFRVNNPTSSCYTLRVYVPGANATNLTSITGYDNANNPFPMASTGGAQAGTFNMGTTATNQDLYLTFGWTAGTSSTRGNFDILVSATERACP